MIDAFLSIVGFSLFLSKYFPSTRKAASLFTVCSIPVLQYLFGAIQLLEMGTKLLLLTGLAAFIALVIFFLLKTIQEKKFNPSSIYETITIGNCFFIIAGLIWLLCSANKVIYGEDEFVWAAFTKVIEFTHRFYTPLDAISVGHAAYPPGVSLFQYYFMAWGGYKEGALFFANGLFILAVLSMMIDIVEKNKAIIFATVLLSTLLITLFYPMYYVTILIEPILGVLFGGGLILVAFYPANPKQLCILLLPIVSFLPLVKEAGLVLALTISSVFALRIIIESIKLTWLSIFLILIPCIMGVIWQHYLHSAGVVSPDNAFTLHNLRELLFNPSARIEITVAHFFDFHRLNDVGKIFICISLLSLFYFITSYFRAKKNRTLLLKDFSIGVVCLIGFSIYLFGLLMIYIFIFSEFEGMNLASYMRYMNGYLMGMGLLTVISCSLLTKIYHVSKKAAWGLVFFLCVLLIALYQPRSFLLSLTPTDYATNKTASTSVRQIIKPYISLVQKYTASGDHIWFIYQQSRGLERVIFRYEISPYRQSNGSDWALGKPYKKFEEEFGKDLWTTPFSQSSFAKEIIAGHYKYLLIAYGDDNFWEHYGTMFHPAIATAKHYSLFKIVNPVKGKVIFEPIREADNYK
jgi:hypothetical protein